MLSPLGTVPFRNPYMTPNKIQNPYPCFSRYKFPEIVRTVREWPPGRFGRSFSTSLTRCSLRWKSIYGGGDTGTTAGRRRSDASDGLFPQVWRHATFRRKSIYVEGRAETSAPAGSQRRCGRTADSRSTTWQSRVPPRKKSFFQRPRVCRPALLIPEPYSGNLR